jgi:hypothetical protein
MTPISLRSQKGDPTLGSLALDRLADRLRRFTVHAIPQPDKLAEAVRDIDTGSDLDHDRPHGTSLDKYR